MHRLAILSCALLPLAACHSRGPDIKATNASVEDVANQVGAATASGTFLSPGHWEGTMAITSMDMPGMPPEIAARVKARLNQPHPFASCLTPEQAKKPNGDFFSGKDAQNCRYDHFTMSGGTIDAVMNCKMDGMTRTMTMKGSYDPDSYTIDVNSTGSGGVVPAGSMTMAMHMAAKRTGACTGTEKD